MSLVVFAGQSNTVGFGMSQATLPVALARPDPMTFIWNDPAGRFEVMVAGVNTGAPGQERDRDFDRTIARALGADRSPQITFVSTGIERTGASTARITGNLTMNGRTRPVAFDAAFHGGDPQSGAVQTLGFSARAIIRRSKWGVTAWRPFVGDVVQIVIEAEMVKR